MLRKSKNKAVCVAMCSRVKHQNLRPHEKCKSWSINSGPCLCSQALQVRLLRARAWPLVWAVRKPRVTQKNILTLRGGEGRSCVLGEAYPHEVLLSCLLSPSVLLFSRLPSRTSAPFFCGLWSWIFWRYLITFTLCSSRGQLIRKRPDSCQCHVDVTGGEKGFICVLSCFPPFASSGYS